MYSWVGSSASVESGFEPPFSQPLPFVTNSLTLIPVHTGQELWQYQPPEGLPDLFDDLGSDKPQEDDIDIYYDSESKDTGLNTPNVFQPVAPFATDGTSLSITAEDLD